MNQREVHPALGKLNTELGEFWLRNPWQRDDHNLSAFERNRILLNGNRGRRLVDVSHLTNADVDSDSRGVAVGDFTGDGMPDVIVRSVGGGPLRVLENLWPKSHWLCVSLRGSQSNSLGLGAKLKFQVGKLTLWRELYPVNSYLSQLPARVHVGLGRATQVDQLTVYWPSGAVQKLQRLPADQHIKIHEGANGWKPFTRKNTLGKGRSAD